MRRIVIPFFVFLFAATGLACNPAQQAENKNDKEVATAAIEVYYFHFTRRCITCNAVESVTIQALNEYYADDLKSGRIVFKSINLDEDSSKSIAKKLKVSGQALLFVRADKQVNLTNEAFMYAKSSPEKLKAKVRQTVDALLK